MDAKPEAIALVAKLLKRHEGWRLKAYPDTLGKATAGCGHLLRAGEGKVGDVFSSEQCEKWFHDDVASVVSDFAKLALPEMSAARQAVILDMLFALGWNRFNEFKVFIKCLRNQAWEPASREIKNSKWAAQVKGRAVELETIMRENSTEGIIK